MRVLFVTRKFPPSVGGLETAAHGLCSALSKKETVKLIKWGGSNAWLPIVYPCIAVATLWQTLFFRPDIIYLQDGMLSPIGAMLKLFTSRPIVVSVHGLDITFRPSIYQRVIKACMKHIDLVVAGSRWCQAEAEKRFAGRQIPIITYGLDDVFYIAESRSKLQKRLSKALDLQTKQLADSKLLLTTGRLVERKGVNWFIDQVMPGIVQKDPNILYVVCGDGPKRQDIEAAIQKHRLQNNVFLLGRVSTTLRNHLYSYADLFVMPNIPTDGDGEGFGLVAIEVSSCGTPVIGAQLEGIQDAVTKGKNGHLVEPKNAAAFQRVIRSELAKPSFNREKVRQYTISNYSWETVSARYVDIFKTLF